MAKKKDRLAPGEQFDSFYKELYEDRWEILKESLLEEKETILLSQELRSPYYLDEASLLVASCLPIEEDDRVLDMCAAPGGKTLSIALRLGQAGSLVANDRSQQRALRLRKVIEECLPEEKKVKVKVTNHDASAWCLFEQESYDKILLDAPCSSERHVINDQKYLDMWSPSRPRRLAKEQYALLSSALIAVRKGGLILYSTCSINPGENEQVIARLFKKHPGEVEEMPLSMDIGEKKEYGIQIMPDREEGLGPMYCCLLKKNEN